MNTQVQPKRAKTPTLKDVLIGVETAYRPITETATSIVSEEDLAETRSFVSAVYEHRQRFMPDVYLLKIATNEKGLEIHLKVDDIDNDGIKINAWDFYQKDPKEVEKRMRKMLQQMYGDIEIADLRFEKGSIILIFTISVAIAAVKGLVIGASVATSLGVFYDLLSRNPNFREKMESVDNEIFQSIKKVVDTTIRNVKKFFGRWFGGDDSGFNPDPVY